MSKPSFLLSAPAFGLALLALAACKGGASEGASTGATGDVVRVKVPEAKCEIAIPAGATIIEAKATSFKVLEKGKNALMDAVFVQVMPVAPEAKLPAPPNATDVKETKNKSGADGSIAVEGSFNNGVQVLHVAQYAYPLGKEWLQCTIQAAKPERRDVVAHVCSGLAPKPL